MNVKQIALQLKITPKAVREAARERRFGDQAIRDSDGRWVFGPNAVAVFLTRTDQTRLQRRHMDRSAAPTVEAMWRSEPAPQPVAGAFDPRPCMDRETAIEFVTLRDRVLEALDDEDRPDTQQVFDHFWESMQGTPYLKEP